MSFIFKVSRVMKTPSISIVIPTRDRVVDLSICLTALTSQVPTDGSVEILICDDGHSSETREKLTKSFPTAAWHQGPKIGPAANRNVGAHYAKGRWIIFLDDDVIPDRSFFATYLAAISCHSNNRSVLCGATFRTETPRSLLWEAPHNPDGRHVISCNMALSKELFLDLRGFDERFPTAAFEDTEFEARIKCLSIPVQFVAGARVYHSLRLCAEPANLAKRWEARVIYAFDLGATPVNVLWRLPVHVAKVIISRFRGQKWKWENVQAAGCFALECLLVLWHLPSWLVKHWRGRRSSFWKARWAGEKLHPKFGF